MPTFANGLVLPDFDPQQYNANTAAAVEQARTAWAQPAPAPAQAPVALPENGMMTDLGHGLAGSFMNELPRITGQAMQAFNIAPETGKQWADAAKERAQQEQYRTTGDLGEGAKSIAPMLATLGVGAVAALAAPEVAAGAALTYGSAGAASALFGGSTYQDVKERSLAAGAPPELAEQQALKAGGTMGIAQLAAGHLFGKILAGGGGVIANQFIRKASVQNALDSFSNPALLKQFGKNYMESMGVQVPLQMGTGAVMNEIEQGGKIDTGASDWEAAKATFGPTVAMTSIMSPLSLFGAHQTVKHREALTAVVKGDGIADMNDPDVVTQRMQAAQQMAKEMRKVAPREGVAKWQDQANLAILAGEPVKMTEGFDAEVARNERAATAEQQAQAEAAQRVEQIEAAPAPQDVEHIDAAPPPDEQGDTINMGTEEGARHERMVANRATIRDRIAQRESNAMETEPVQEIDVHGVDEEKTGNTARNVEDANARLEAAAKSGEEGPAQMTARLLGLPTDSAVQRDPSFTGREQPQKLNTTESRMKAMRGLFGNIKPLKDWAKLDPKDLPTAIRDEWNARGGVKADDNVTAKLATAYKAMTGREIHEPIKSEVFNESASTRQAASEERQRSESDRAAAAAESENAARAEQVAQAQRDAAAGRQDAPTQEGTGAGEKPLTAAQRMKQTVDAAIAKATAGMNPDLTEAERANLPTMQQHAENNRRYTQTGDASKAPGGVDRRAGEPTAERGAAALAVDGLQPTGDEHVPTEGSSKEGQGRTDQSGTVSQSVRGEEGRNAGGEQGQKAGAGQEGEGNAAPADVRSKAARAVIEQKNTQAQIDAHDAVATKVQRKLKALERAAAQDAIKGETNPERQALIGAVRAHLESLDRVRADLVGDNSDAVGTAERHLSGKEPSTDPRYWHNSMNGPRAAFGYVAAKDMARTASERERTLLAHRGEEAKDSPRARAAAKDALAALAPERRAELEAQVKAHLDGVDAASKALGGGKVKEAMKGEGENAAQADAFIRHLDKALLNKTMTYEEYEKQMAQYMATRPLKRGIEGLHDAALAAVVGKDSALHVALAHMAENARYPVMRELSARLAKLLQSTGVEIRANDAINGGQFVPASGAVEIGRGGMNHMTLAHEAVHVASHAAITRAQINEGRPSRVLSEKQIAEVKALKTLREVRDSFAEVADLDKDGERNALENDHEFLAEAMTNPDVISKLQTVKGLWGKFVNFLRSSVGLSPKYQTEFEKLVGASNVLFGHPNRGSDEVFKNALNAKAPKGSPRWAVNMFQKALGDMARMTVGREPNRAKIRDAEFAWTTVNHQTERLTRRMKELKAAFPEHAAKLQEVLDAFIGPRDVITRRNAESQHTINGPHESNWHMKEMRKVALADPQGFKDMHEMSRRARQSQFDPRKQTIEEFRKANPDASKEQLDLARKVQADWNRMKDTPAGQLYAKLRDYSHLGLTRQFAMNMNNARHINGIGRDENLDWFTHTQHEGRPESDVTRQAAKLQSAMARTVGDAKAEVARLGADDASRKAHIANLVKMRLQKADPDLIKQTETAYETKMASTEVKNALDHYQTVEGIHREYTRQAAQPYVHFGRSGEYMVHFEVRPEHFDAVRKIVTGSMKDRTGLDRDMGPDTGNRVVDMRFEDEAQFNYAHAKFEELRNAGAFKNDEGVDTYGKGRIVDRYQHTDGATPTFIRKMMDRIDGLEGVDGETKAIMKREINDAHYSSLPDSNPLKAQMMADMSHGSSTDFINTWAKRQTMQNVSLARGNSAVMMGDALNRLDAAMKAVRSSGLPADVAVELSSYERESKARIASMAQSANTPMIDLARAFTAPFRLALSAGYLLMTGYQPWQQTLPHLGARYGYIESAKAMARAYGIAHQLLKEMFKQGWADSKGDSTWQRFVSAAQPAVGFGHLKNPDGSYMLEGARKELLDHIQYVQLLNFGQTRQIGRPQTVEGGAIQGMKGDGVLGKFANKVSEVNTVASIFPHYVEMMNRMVSAIAAHELWVTKGAKTDGERSDMMKNVAPETQRDALKFAVGTIRNTDGDHSQGNVARMTGRRGFAGKFTPLPVGFNQYDFQTLELTSRLVMDAAGKDKEAQAIARKQLAGVFSMTAAIAGTLGLPLVGLFSALYNRTASALQDDGETPPDIQKGWDDGLTSIFGEKIGKAVSHGLPRLIDWDMAGRSGYQDLAPMSEFMASRAKLGDAIAQGAVNFLGPAVGVGIGMAKGARSMYEHNYPDAIDNALPAFARNAAQAYRMQKYGYEHVNGSNELIPVPVSTWNVISKAAGITSGTKADIGEAQQHWNVNQDVMKSRMQIIHDNLLRASDHDDAAGMGEALQQLVMFSAMQPQFRHAPQGIGEAIRQRFMNEAMAGAMGGVRGGGRGALPFLSQFQGQGGLPAFGQ